MTPTILVTGAHGQLGNEIQSISTLYPDYNFIFTDSDTLDISNPEALHLYFEQLQPQYCINCAAYTKVDHAETDISTAYLVNEQGALNLANACRTHHTTLLHISTDFVFKGEVGKPLDEAFPTDPVNIYGKSKLAGEKAVIGACHNHIIIRTSWLYSSFGHNFVKTMYRLGHEKESLNVVSDQIGTPTYAHDLARVLLQVIQQLQSLDSEELRKPLYGLYHYSNEGVASWYDLAQAVMDMAGLNTSVRPIPTTAYPTPASRPCYSVMDKGKIKQAFQVNIPHWQHSLKECMIKLEENSK